MVAVAIVYELVVNFGTDDDAAAHAAEICAAWPTLRLRDLDLPLYGPHDHRSATEFAVSVSGVLYGGLRHPGLDPYSLTEAEILVVRDWLYELLARMHGYHIAMVGWDPEELVDEREVRRQIDELGVDHLSGLVMRSPLAGELGIDGLVAPFDRDHVWLPAAGVPHLRRLGSG